MTGILTTHVGSLPRSAAVTDVLFAVERGEPVDPTVFDGTIGTGVDEAVRRQVDAGIDLVSDGEMAKISYATYIKDRITGFAGDSPDGLRPTSKISRASWNARPMAAARRRTGVRGASVK